MRRELEAGRLEMHLGGVDANVLARFVAGYNRACLGDNGVEDTEYAAFSVRSDRHGGDMRPYGPTSLVVACGVASVGVLVAYLGYSTVVVPLVKGGGAVPTLLWTVLVGVALLGVMGGGMLARRGTHIVAIGAWVTILRNTVQLLLASTKMPGFLKFDVFDTSVFDWSVALVLETGLWSVTAWLGLALLTVINRVNAWRASQTR
ncbi:hypothetical protein F0U60_40085 [Archangium minus]|uniref:Uncharacterized protein n=1 Tax=Archangium minus TaxID=83450 RepID=A0ABY9X2S8_9BACT|nr:hypothetical protein F0U60_40085 [Archangium minus]